MGWPKVIAFLVALVLAQCHAMNKHNVSFADLHICKQYKAVAGYNYRTFFKLHALDYHLPHANDTAVDLLLYAMASRDGHILLSEEPVSTSTGIEIVLGGGSNTFSQIRFGQKGTPLKTKSSAGLLSPIHPLPIRVNIATSGQIKVYVANLSADPFMEAPMPIAIATKLQYVSFSTWGTAVALWFYDCPEPVADNSTATNGTAIEGNELELVLNDKDRLKRDILDLPQWVDAPKNFTGVELSQLYVKGFRYDQPTSLVELSGAMRMSWRDPRYHWNTSDYNGTDVLHDVCEDIWMPSFSPASLFDGSFSQCMLLHDGSVVAEITEFVWDNFCTLPDSYRWPYDETTCRLQIEVTGYEQNVTVRLANRAVVFDRVFEESEWAFKHLVKPEVHQSVMMNGLPPSLELYILMERKSEIHASSIYPSYFVGNLLISISFLTDGRSRLLLNSLGLIVLLDNFLSMSAVVPGGETPKIYAFFQWSLVFYAISSALYVIDLWLKRSRRTLAPSSWLNRAITFPALRYALAMDQRSNYNTLQQKNVKWDELTCVLNRIMMLVVLVVFAVGFTKP